MEVRRQITLCFIASCCVNIVYTEGITTDQPDGNHASTPLPSEESSNLTKLETRNFNGKITARKIGAKLKINIESKNFWKDNKSIDSKSCTAKKLKGGKGEKRNDAIPVPVNLKGEKGEKGFYGIPGQAGLKGEKGDKGADTLQGAKGEKGDMGTEGESGPPGYDGNKGEPGSKGTDGQKGDKGEDGIYSDLRDSRIALNYGNAINPAYSCKDIGENGEFYLNIANHFQVMCQKKYHSCVKIIKNLSSFTELRKDEKIFLSAHGLDLREFYNLKSSQLSYLMTRNDGFYLTLEYSQEVKIVEILCWNGITMTILPKPEKVERGCTIIKEEKEAKTRLQLNCKPGNYLPMDFGIEAKTENFSIELISLCFI